MCDNNLASPVIPAAQIANGVSNADFVIYVNIMYNSSSVLYIFEKKN